MVDVPIELIAERLDYNPITGLFTKKYYEGMRPQALHHVGKVAGVKTGHGYIRLMVNGVRVYAHRAAWALSYGHYPEIIDHINGERDDNSLSNLRDVSDQQNVWNSSIGVNNKSGYKGVHRNSSGKWCSQITFNYKCQTIGVFETAEEAALAYDKKAKELFGVYAVLNTEEN